MENNALSRARACGVALLLAGFGLFGASDVHAGMIETYTSKVYSEVTDWTHIFTLPQFDDQDGARTLLSVVVTLDASIEAMGRAENLEAWEHTITLTLDSTVALSFLGEALVAPTGVNRVEVFTAAPFDGDLDFAGPSGDTFDLSGFADASTARSGDDDLSPWIGDSVVDILGEGISLSTASGPGNVAFEFATRAYGQVTVRYEYIPTPGAWLILAAAAGLLAPRARRRAA